VGSSSVRGKVVGLSENLCVFRQRSLQRADASSRGVLQREKEREILCVCVCVCVCVALSVIRRKDCPLHLQRIGRRSRTEKERKKKRKREPLLTKLTKVLKYMSVNRLKNSELSSDTPHLIQAVQCPFSCWFPFNESYMLVCYRGNVPAITLLECYSTLDKL
jgi:hypothetical protein